MKNRSGFDSIRQQVLCLILLSLPASLLGQERELYWKELAVTARLDADGVLHIRERQTMVFTGAWNGGERDFRVDFGQRLKFVQISRVDTIGGGEVPMREADLEQIDEYKWASDTKLRWRSRLPSDPLFEKAELTYVLDYQLSNILIRDGDVYLLDHDFAFSDRVGDILSFTLHVDLDSAWEPVRAASADYSAGPIPPGRGYVVRFPLKRVAPGEPAGVHRSATPAERGILAACLIGAALLLPWNFYRREKRLGRFEPLLPVSEIDSAWLQKNVFSFLPEVVGAAWDERTSAPEVAAVLARMVAEGKLESRVEKRGWGPFTQNTLHLKLLRDRDFFEGYEKDLIDAFFVAGRETSSEIVREHYKKTGFDPASKIRKGLDARVKAIASDEGERGPMPPWWITAILAVVAAGLVATALVFALEDVLVVAVGIALVTVPSTAALIAAYSWRDRVADLIPAALAWILPMIATFGGLYWLVWSGAFRAGFWATATLVFLWIFLWRSVLNMAKIRQVTGRIRLRKRLASARAFFRAELRKPQPRLEDAWFPYLLAFGLGPQVDRWFRAFGTSGAPSGAVPSSSASFSSGSSGWTGGGGAFGGAGASASWAVAAGSMASGVAAPGSGRSGGGGGSSSGGGGGGGW